MVITSSTLFLFIHSWFSSAIYTREKPFLKTGVDDTVSEEKGFHTGVLQVSCELNSLGTTDDRVIRQKLIGLSQEKRMLNISIRYVSPGLE